MLRLVHFSDPHVQLPGWRRRTLRELGPLRALATVELWKGRGRDYDGAAERLRALVRDAEALRADHVVCTGDLTQLGHPEEFALARAAIEPLAGDAERFTTLAGNHDRYPWGGGPSTLFEQHFPEQARSDLPAPLRVRLLGAEAALVALDSVGPLAWPVVSHGRATPVALEALVLTLRLPELRGLCKLVLSHHAPTRRGARRDWPLHDLRGASALMRIAAEGGADAILCGHVHDRFDDPPRRDRPRVICAGSATERDRDGFWELEIEGGRISRARSHRIGGAGE